MKNNKNNNFSVLIPDGEEIYFTFYVLNCLSQVSGVKVYVMSNFKNNSIRFSKNIHHFSYYPKTNIEAEWINSINVEMKKFDIDLVMPIHDHAHKKIIKHKHLIYKNRICLLPSLENYKIACNKGLLTNFMVKNKIQESNSLILKSGDNFNDEKIKFPVLLKPIEVSGGGKGILKFYKKETLKNFLKKSSLNCSYLVEEFIEGYDLGCNVLCNKGELLAFTIQKGTLWSNKPFSPQIGLVFLYEDVLYKKVERLMQLLNWSGPANIDLRFDLKTKDFRVLEINPRFWTTVDASVAAGVNFPYLQCLHSLGLNIERPNYNFVEYLTFLGFIKSLKTNIGILFKFKFIMNNTQVQFFLRDPLPMIHRFLFRFWQRSKGKLTVFFRS